MNRDDLMMWRDDVEYEYLDAAANPGVPYSEVIALREQLIEIEEQLDKCT